AFGKSDLAQRRVPLRDPATKAQITATLAKQSRPIGFSYEARLLRRCAPRNGSGSLAVMPLAGHRLARPWRCCPAASKFAASSPALERIPIERCPGQVGVCYPLDG